MRNFVKAILVGALALPLAAQAQISTTKHNLGSTGSGSVKTSATAEICIFCHTPHNASTTKALWNHTLSVSGYSWDDGSGSTKTSQGTTLPTTQAQFSINGSGRCLSCHDGTVSVGNVMNYQASATTFSGFTAYTNRVTAAGNIDVNSRYAVGESSNLSKNHPVGIPFAGQTGGAPVGMNNYYGVNTASCTTQSGGGCVNNATNGYGLPLYLKGAVYQIECATCHEPHGAGNNNQFLRVANTGSALCLTCHQK
ncbi:MAG TPA: cytochrome c3 family protein [Anaeromyxobacteraceae bacterium]|jgi:predicted CXXCH cytochrome family protein|nr:cytochrome c3 family protein [Anaeromyxobacteraceae bacterium]